MLQGEVRMSMQREARPSLGKQNTKALERQEITFRDRIILGPVDRYKKYNIFPWKFIIHLVSLIVCSYQAQTIVGIQADFAYNS